MDGGYGFQFWTYNDTLNKLPLEIIEAMGNGDQSILFCKKLNLLVVTTGGNYNKSTNQPYSMLTKYILPSLKEINISHKN